MKGIKTIKLLLAMIIALSIVTACATEEVKDKGLIDGEASTEAVQDSSDATSDDTTDDATSLDEDKIVIEIFPDLWPEKMMKSLEAAGLADKVEFREVPQNQYENKVRMMIAGGDVGDIICIDAPNIAFYANMGALEPLDAYWPEEDFDDLVDSAKTAMTWNGQKWAAPLNESNVVLYYNKEMFEEAGITPAKTLDEAWSFEQLLDAAEKLTKTDDQGNVTTYGILPAMFTPNNKNEGMTYTQMLWTWWSGSEVISPDGTTAKGYFDSPENRRAIQFFYDLHNTYNVAPQEDMQSGFAGGKIAMWTNGPWMANVWANDFPEFEGKWGVMPLPKDQASASPSGSWNLAMTKQCDNKELAYQVIQAITGEEGATIYCTETMNIPARKSILEKETIFQEGELWEVINAQLLNNSKARPVTPVYPSISEALMDCYNAVAYGQDVDTAIMEATEKMEKALTQ